MNYYIYKIFNSSNILEYFQNYICVGNCDEIKDIQDVISAHGVIEEKTRIIIL